MRSPLTMGDCMHILSTNCMMPRCCIRYAVSSRIANGWEEIVPRCVRSESASIHGPWAISTKYKIQRANQSTTHYPSNQNATSSSSLLPRYLPPLIMATPVISSLPRSRSRSMGSLWPARDGASPHPQSYVASRFAQSNSGLPRRSLTRLCTKHSHVAADRLEDVCGASVNT